MHAFAAHTMERAAVKKTPLFNPRRLLAAAGLLCATGPSGDPVPTGPISEYLVHCRSWMSFSAEACTGLADRLAAVDLPTRAERLALLMARGTLARSLDARRTTVRASPPSRRIIRTTPTPCISVRSACPRTHRPARSRPSPC